MARWPVPLVAALTLVGTALLAPGAAASRPDQRADDDLGRRLYVSDCASCHGVDGRGRDGAGPSLEDAGEAGAHFYITSGRMPMDSVEGQSRRKPVRYEDDEIDALVAYVAGLGDGPELPAVQVEGTDLVRGNTLYRANCAACHNSAGSGGALGQGVYAPELYPATPEQVAAAVRVGPGAMPAFGPGAIDGEELDDLVAYVDFLKDPEDRGGAPLGRVGPVPEGLVAWVVGLGLLLMAVRWIGTRERTHRPPAGEGPEPSEGGAG